MYQQNYGYYPNTPYQSTQKPMVPLQPTLKGRPVSSIDEVRAIAVDFQYVTREEFEEVINQLRGATTPPPAPQPPAAKEEFRF